jgi:hypothetical protein
MKPSSYLTMLAAFCLLATMAGATTFTMTNSIFATTWILGIGK